MNDRRKKPHSPKKTLKKDPPNYRPVTCLPMMWKILTAHIREEIYYFLISCRLFPKEPKGYHKATRDIQYIDQHILKKRKTRRKKCNYGADWLQKGIWCGPTKLDNRLSKNVQDIRRSNKVYREYHEKLESRTDSRRKKFTITICNGDYATKSRI